MNITNILIGCIVCALLLVSFNTLITGYANMTGVTPMDTGANGMQSFSQSANLSDEINNATTRIHDIINGTNQANLGILPKVPILSDTILWIPIIGELLKITWIVVTFPLTLLSDVILAFGHVIGIPMDTSTYNAYSMILSTVFSVITISVIGYFVYMLIGKGGGGNTV